LHKKKGYIRMGNIINGNNYVVDKNNMPLTSDKVCININGNNNVIKINDTKFFLARLNISLNGDNCYIEIGDHNYIYGDISINMGSGPMYHINNSKVIIGNNNRFSGYGEGEITIVNSNALIEIKNDCMFANGVMIYNTDGHPIYEYNTENKHPINCGGLNITIGNHVWIGKNATILKGVTIPDDCIIGRASVVASKTFTDSHCAIVGNPAKIIKTNVTWDLYSKEYVDNEADAGNQVINSDIIEKIQFWEKAANIKKKKVLFDISVLGSGYIHIENRTGVYRVAENALKALLEEMEFDIYFTAFAYNDIECIEYLKEYFPSLEHKFVRAKRKFKIHHIFRKDYDICFTPYAKIPSSYRYNIWCKNIIIIHDLIQVLRPEWVQEECQREYRKLLKSLTSKTIVLCNSEYTKKDLLEYKTKVNPKNVSTIPLGVDDIYHTNYTEEDVQNIKKKYGIESKKYFFSISSMNPRKNFKHTVLGFIDFIEKYQIDDAALVLAGPKGWGNIFDGVDLEKYKKQIIITGFVDEKDLPILYYGAIGSLYLSLYEGFGLPPLESIYCNTPPIASNVTSIPEVISNAGILIDPIDRDALIKAYNDLYFGNFDLNAFKTNAEIQKSKYNWDNFKKILLEVFK